MPARVKVRAVIWVGERVVVNRVHRRGGVHVTLPGGRVNERASMIDALRREVLEEVGLEIEIGHLLFAAEVVSGARIQDVELVFEAAVNGSIDASTLDLVDPSDPGVKVLPPVLDELVRMRREAAGTGPRWLGNIYNAGFSSA